MATLEDAGFVYNPFTTQDIFGQPIAAPMLMEQRKTLPGGHDTSALPDLAGRPGYAYDVTQGSGRHVQRNETRREWIRGQNQMTTAIFGMLLVAAVFWTRSGSQ